MGLRGPHLTLLGGITLAAVLAMLSVTATSNTAAPAAPEPTAQQGIGTASSTPASVAIPPATFAGRVAVAGATLAISIRDGRAVAYLCDGMRIEAWLRGTAVNGALSLADAKGGSLTATYVDGVISGTVSTGGRRWSFTVPVVSPPSGLYRATVDVRNAPVVCGWVRLADGSVTGTCTTNGANTRPAPLPDPVTGATTVDGVPLTARPLS